MSYQQPGPLDQNPQGWQGYPQQPYGAQPGYGQQPIVVNVVQNAGGPVVVTKPVNHLLHAVLTFFTGGLWLFVWIPLCLKRRKVVVYR